MPETFTRTLAAWGFAFAAAWPAASSLGQTSCQTAWTTFNPTVGPGGATNRMCFHEGRLFMRGAILSAGGVPISNRVAAWDGQTWTDVSQGYSMDPLLSSPMVSAFGNVYAAGEVILPAIPPNSPERAPGLYWNGQVWQPTPHTGLVVSRSFALFPSGGKLYARGAFSRRGPNGFGLPSRSMAVWDGVGEWQTLGPSDYDVISGGVGTIVEHNGTVFIAGSMTRIDHLVLNPQHVPVNNIARLVDGGWLNAGSGVNASATLVTFNNDLYAYGDFTATGEGAPLNRFARWSGTQWVPVAGGVSAAPVRVIEGDHSSGTALFLQFANPATAFNTDSRYPATVAVNGFVRFDGVGFTGLPAAAGIPFNDVVSGELRHAGPAVYVSMNNRNLGTGGPGHLARLGRADDIDLDQDGIKDIWETEGMGLDVDCDGTIDLDLHALGATPDHKDIFVEVDGMVGQFPDLDALSRVRQAFANAPVANLDGETGIRLHILVDRTDIPAEPFPNAFADFHRIKATNFGTQEDRDHPNALAILEAKRKVYRYCMFAVQHGTSPSSGLAELRGNDFMVTLGHPTWEGRSNTLVRAATFMHELGHTLGLEHSGGQVISGAPDSRFNFKPNYHSVMNYSWQMPGRQGWTLDYSREALPTIDESAVSEAAGFGGNPFAAALIGPAPPLIFPEGGPVDLDRNGTIDPPYPLDCNHVRASLPASPDDLLLGHNDWAALRLNFRSSSGYANGAAPAITSEEMDSDTFDFLQQFNDPPACAADFNGDGFLNPDDLSDFVTCFFLDVQFPGACPEADFNGDGFRDPDDLSDFITTFFLEVALGC